jgi:hypothetical protein
LTVVAAVGRALVVVDTNNLGNLQSSSLHASKVLVLLSRSGLNDGSGSLGTTSRSLDINLTSGGGDGVDSVDTDLGKVGFVTFDQVQGSGQSSIVDTSLNKVGGGDHVLASVFTDDDVAESASILDESGSGVGVRSDRQTGFLTSLDKVGLVAVGGGLETETSR